MLAVFLHLSGCHLRLPSKHGTKKICCTKYLELLGSAKVLDKFSIAFSRLPILKLGENCIKQTAIKFVSLYLLVVKLKFQRVILFPGFGRRSECLQTGSFEVNVSKGIHMEATRMSKEMAEICKRYCNHNPQYKMKVTSKL